MRITKSLLASASGITIIHLWNAMTSDRDHEEGTIDAVEVVGEKRQRRRLSEMSIENLDLSYNGLMDYDQIPHPLTVNSLQEDPWEVVCCWIMTKCCRLKSVDFSYCFDTEQQATAFCHGLSKALKDRNLMGLVPLERIVMKGFQRKFVDVHNSFMRTISFEDSSITFNSKLFCF